MEFQYNRDSGNQKLPAPSGVFYMAYHCPVPCLYMGDKAVGPAYKGSGNYVFIGHDNVPPGLIGPVRIPRLMRPGRYGDRLYQYTR